MNCFQLIDEKYPLFVSCFPLTYYRNCLRPVSSLYFLSSALNFACSKSAWYGPRNPYVTNVFTLNTAPGFTTKISYGQYSEAATSTSFIITTAASAIGLATTAAGSEYCGANGGLPLETWLQPTLRRCSNETLRKRIHLNFSGASNAVHKNDLGTNK